MAEYKIISITPMIDIDERGRFFKKYRVTYRFGNTEDFIDIREEEFSADKARKLIERIIAELEKLMR